MVGTDFVVAKPIIYLAIPGLGLHIPSDRIVKSAE